MSVMIFSGLAMVESVKRYHTSPGPAPRPLSTHAPMKLPYVVAFAFQIELPRETSVDARRTGRRPKVELNGILE